VTNTRVAARLYPATSINFLCSKSVISCLNTWRTSFNYSIVQDQHFLSLRDKNCKILQPSYSKSGSWLPYIGQSVTLCVRLTRAILNHVPIRKYRQHFFPTGCIQCLCDYCQVETYIDTSLKTTLSLLIVP